MNWLVKAMCREFDPEWMFPDNDQDGIALAKSICGRCPVRTECLADAIRVGDTEWGIRGGLKAKERRAIAKFLGDKVPRSLTALETAVQHVLNPVTAAPTLTDVWQEHSHPLPRGHIGWRGPETLDRQGHTYTPGQIAFLVDRGRPAEGIVRRNCDVPECFHPRHINDTTERKQERAPAAVG